MNKLFSTLLIFSFVIAIPITVSAQRNPAKSADEAFSKQQYSLAIDKYKKAYTKVKKNKEEKNRITAQLAECYRLTGNFKRASISYKRLIKNDYDKRNPELLLHYANMLKMTGNYDEAINQYNAYALRVPEDPRGVNGAESTALIEEWIANPSKYEVTNVKKINSREADFAPAYTTDNYNEIVFTSTREGATGKETDKWTAQNFSDLFVAKIDRKDEWSEPVLFDATEKLNTNANEGAAVFNSKFNTIYFTRCPNDQQKESGCQIYKARRTGRTWSEAEMVEMVGIDTLSTIGQPTISEGELVIYFAANRRNGLGGKDIWVAFRDSKSEPFGRPMNLGETINTPGDEMFPFLRNDTTLFFASDGHGGMGGLDIFVTKIDTSGNWGEPKNLKYPINSISDDFAIVFHPTDEYGFLSSSRKGSRGLEDIWYFIEPPLLFSLSGTVRDDRTLMTMGDVNVQLIGSSGISVTTRTNDEGFYSFGESQLETNTMYEVLVAKPNYFNTKGTFTTVGVEFSKDFVKDFNLIPIPAEPIELPEILYDLAKWELKPQYQDSLQGLIQTLRDNPNIVVELAAHTDARDSYERNDVLSQRRAQSVVDYLIVRGIEPSRLVAKGYGERVPITLKRDVIRDGYPFTEGTTMTEDYIAALTSNGEKEAAHQLNRRTEFRVLRKDYVPSATNIDLTKINIAINPEDNAIVFTEAPKTGTYISTCIINGYNEEFAFDRTADAMISLDKALDLLKWGAISKNDFEGDPEKILANNTIANKAIINIKEINIANQKVENVMLRVNYKLNYGLVFGDRFLKKFGKYSYNTKTNKLTIGVK
ncbi:MAG: OmpA family protein [Lentimicrobiaceae bacterium]|jgi:peptidoglycan-associated lipoprotein|nr:OmpA family protein [Lentimicrobiaceae bacterium]MCP4909214.1 OmpA family protein [Bacteroidota bacterium]MBT3453582.1 OmpA family protein [Lentimicrobiaceae bacterium]MBT3818923.1 OmpA family protein [Lentimicrobiaceae bacterium]MBT4060446.1 OmpA family protein [Lentimicrobiaceae bacterium]